LAESTRRIKMAKKGMHKAGCGDPECSGCLTTNGSSKKPMNPAIKKAADRLMAARK
jgi:hypothetical protein